jgi:hypothetical protein
LRIPANDASSSRGLTSSLLSSVAPMGGCRLTLPLLENTTWDLAWSREGRLSEEIFKKEASAWHSARGYSAAGPVGDPDTDI